MTPLPPEATARALRDLLDVVSEALLARVRPAGAPGIADGEAGLALAHFALDAVLPGRGHAELATRRLERALTTMATAPSPASLIEGCVGVAWAAQRMAPGQVDPVIARVDAMLRARLRRVKRVNADLFQGLAGVIRYALDRPAPGGDGLVSLALDRLESSAVTTREGACWRSAILLPRRAGARQLGMAHGGAGVLTALTALAARGIEAPRARALAGEVAAWMLAQRRFAGGRARLPDALLDDGSPVIGRAACCRGDLGAALALVRAGAAFGRAAWREAGAEVARGVAATPAAESGIRDACLCHGAAGQALCFHRLAGATGERAFVEARDRWLAALCAMRGRRGVAGYRAWDGRAWRASAAWLNGAAGVALVATAALGDDERGWDAPLGTEALAPDAPPLTPPSARACAARGTP